MVARRFCLVPKCPRSDREKVKPTDVMHRLPANPELREKWAELLGINLKKAVKINRPLVCQLHFPEQYHSKICVLLRNCNQTNTCNAGCSRIPLDVLPKRFCPSEEVEPSSSSATTGTTATIANAVDSVNNAADDTGVSDLIKVVPGQG